MVGKEVVFSIPQNTKMFGWIEKDILSKNSSAIGVLKVTQQEISFLQHRDDFPPNAVLRLAKNIGLPRKQKSIK